MNEQLVIILVSALTSVLTSIIIAILDIVYTIYKDRVIIGKRIKEKK